MPQLTSLLQLGALRALRRRPLLAFAVAVGFYTSGCLSNEYVIPKPELARLSRLPPEQRGQAVGVVQSIGERRGPALDPQAPPPQAYGNPNAGPPPGPDYYADPGPQVGVGIMVNPLMFGSGGPGYHNSYASPGPRSVAPPPRAAAPRAPSTGSRSGPGSAKTGGGKSDDLAVLLVVMAVAITFGAAVTEGIRFDGPVAMYPEQPVYLKYAGGEQRVLPLAAITPADADAAAEAKVMDDEGWPWIRGARRPLDRKGFAFKLGFGSLSSHSAAAPFSGTGMDVQLGYFPHHMVGILGNMTLGGGNDNADNSVTRAAFSGELQVLPLSIWRLHLGGFGHVGKHLVSDALGDHSGLGYGGGVLAELSLTTRLALFFRYDYSHAKIADAGRSWADTSHIGGGIAIY